MKKFSIRCVRVVAVLCIAVSLVTSVLAVTTKTLGVTRYEQEKSKWCWVACIQMMSKYKTGTKTSQATICKFANDGVVENTAGNTDQIADAITHFTNLDTNVKDSYLKYSTSQGQIDDKRPFVIRIKWLDTGAHFVVIDGYKTSTYQYLHVVDPAEDCPETFERYHSLKDSENGAILESGVGYWTHTVYFVKGG